MTLFPKFIRVCLVVSPLLAGTVWAGPNVFCWAPGMPAPIQLNSLNLGLGISLGRPYSYKIYGVAGRLTLGDQVFGAVADPNDSARRFRKSLLLSLGSQVNSYSYVKLKVNGSRYYPKYLEVRGDRPGSTVGPVRILGETWEVKKVFGAPDTSLSFQMAGLLDDAYYNLNPNGYFYVVGECHAQPPIPTGKLTVPKNFVIKNNAVTVSFQVNRGDNRGETPPFSGYDPNGEVLFTAN